MLPKNKQNPARNLQILNAGECSAFDKPIEKIHYENCNVIGNEYFNSDEIVKAHFIEVAERIALKNGSKAVKFRRIFQETHAYLPIANVYTYFLHAAHEVFGLNFDFRVSARSANAKTIVQEYDGKRIELSIENL